MAITSNTGEPVSIRDLSIEFDGAFVGGIEHHITRFYGADRYVPVPREGTISLGDFYGADLNTAQVNCMPGKLGYTTTTGSGRFGFSYYKGSGHDYASGESGDHTQGFGTIQRNVRFSTGHRMEAFYSAIYGRPQAWVYLTKRHAVNSGFTTLSVRFNDKSPHYGESSEPDTTDYQIDLNRADADYFGVVPDSYVHGSSAYYWAWECTEFSDLNGVQYAMEEAAKNASNGVTIKLIT